MKYCVILFMNNNHKTVAMKNDNETVVTPGRIRSETLLAKVI